MKLGFKAEKIYLDLKDSIASGVFQPGNRMPTEKELCKKLKASRNTVRAALKKLIDEELLESLQGSGSYVKTSDNNSKTISLMYHGCMEMVIEVQNLLLEKGCLMTLFSQKTEGWSPDLEARFLGSAMRQKHYGILASCTPLEPRNDKLMKKLANSGIRIVHTEPFSSSRLPAQDYCMPDYQKAGELGVEYLAEKGYKKIIYVDPAVNSPFNQLMKKGLKSSEKKLGIKIDFFNPQKEGLENLPQDAAICPVYKEACAIKWMKKNIPAVISLELPGDEVSEEFPSIRFDRLNIFKKAINAILTPGTEIKELIKPHIE